MPEVIRHGRVEPDDWFFVDLPAGAGGDGPGAPASPGSRSTAAEKRVLPLAAWKRDRATQGRGDALGVWLGPADDPAELAPDLAMLALVAVHFPRFTDGRGYSTAVLLRTRFGYRGELRAFGDVGRDQLFQLARCGFDSFALATHRDLHAALAGLHGIELRYQGSVDDPLPLFRKRAVRGEPPPAWAPDVSTGMHLA